MSEEIQDSKEGQVKSDFWNLIRRMDKVETATSKKIRDIRKDLSEIKEIVKNGVVKGTKNNKEAIEFLDKEVREMKALIAKKEGKTDAFKIVGSLILGAITGAVGLFTILSYLGYL